MQWAFFEELALPYARQRAHPPRTEHQIDQEHLCYVESDYEAYWHRYNGQKLITHR
jgi:hypothetical protein